MTDFHKKMNKLFETGKIVQSEIDSKLTLHFRDKYGISVLCSSFSSGMMPNGKTQGKFFALISVRDSKNEIIRAIRSFKGIGNYGVDINSPCFGAEYRSFANELVNEYLKIKNMSGVNCDELVATIYELDETGKNHLYGKSCAEIKTYFHKKYNVDMRDVVGVEDSKYYVLVDQMDDYINIVHHKAEINDIVYEMMSKYDYFEVLRNGKVNISYLLKSALDEGELESYLMRRTLI